MASESGRSGRRLTVGDGALWVSESGSEGDPLVLVHGSWVDHRVWDAVAPALSQGFRLLRYDRRGHGQSGRFEGPYSIEKDADDLEELLRLTDHFPTHVVGHSLGGSVALRFAGRRPDLVRGLLVHEPPLLGLIDPEDPDLVAFRRAADRVAALVVAHDPRAAAQAFVEAIAVGPGGWSRTSPELRTMMVAHAERWFSEASDPEAFLLPAGALDEFYAAALVSSGSESPALYRRIADRLAPLLPNATREEWRGTGHAPHVTHPEMFAGRVLGYFLERSVPSH